LSRGHFYFAQRGHYHFAATGSSRRHFTHFALFATGFSGIPPILAVALLASKSDLAVANECGTSVLGNTILQPSYAGLAEVLARIKRYEEATGHRALARNGNTRGRCASEH